MRTNDITLETFGTNNVRFACGFAPTLFLVPLLGLLLVLGFEGSSFGQESQQKTFSSPGEASNALFEAAQKQDEQALEAILGAGKEVTSSSDEVEDNLEREHFTRKYEEMHRLVREPDGNTILYIGAENWPFPVPLVSKDGTWYFDSDTGIQEIAFRRVGENEATAIEVCEEFALTKTEGQTTRDLKAASEDPITRFAQGLITAGAANADSNNGDTDHKDSYLFHGYYFRRGTRNSAAATNGYVAGGNKNDALTLVAYPAEYRTSGVMTFIVTKGGIVYEKDLGPSTTTVAPKIKAPAGSSWHPAV